MGTGLDTIAPIAMMIGYLIYWGLKKACEADQKAEKMLTRKREEDFKADFIEKACASKEQEREWSKIPRRDKERESAEVLRTILCWRDDFRRLHWQRCLSLKRKCSPQHDILRHRICA